MSQRLLPSISIMETSMLEIVDFMTIRNILLGIPLTFLLSRNTKIDLFWVCDQSASFLLVDDHQLINISLYLIKYLQQRSRTLLMMCLAKLTYTKFPCCRTFVFLRLLLHLAITDSPGEFTNIFYRKCWKLHNSNKT